MRMNYNGITILKTVKSTFAYTICKIFLVSILFVLETLISIDFLIKYRDSDINFFSHHNPF